MRKKPLSRKAQPNTMPTRCSQSCKKDICAPLSNSFEHLSSDGNEGKDKNKDDSDDEFEVGDDLGDDDELIEQAGPPKKAAKASRSSTPGKL